MGTLKLIDNFQMYNLNKAEKGHPRPDVQSAGRRGNNQFDTGPAQRAVRRRRVSKVEHPRGAVEPLLHGRGIYVGHDDAIHRQRGNA